MRTRVALCAANILSAALLASGSPSRQPQPTASPLPEPEFNEKRQQSPFSVPNVVPKVQDTQFYSFDGQSTKFVGSTSAYLSIPTVTATSGSQTITTTGTAKVGLFTGTPQGSTDTEYSLVLAPELVDQIKQIMTQTSTKRDLDERGIPGLTLLGALSDLLGPEIAFALAEIVPLGLIQASAGGLAVVAGTAIAMGPIVIAGAAFLGAVVSQFKLIVDLHNNGGFPTAIKVPIDAFRDKKTCPSTNAKCSSCSGANLICTSGGSAKCPCDPDSQCTTKGEDLPDCNDGVCQGSSNHICTAGANKDCQCTILLDFDADPVLPNVQWLTQQQQMLDALVSKGNRPHPADNPTCSTTGANSLVSSLKTTANTRSPKELLYIMRDTLCSNKCENPPDIPSGSVIATPDGDGCEIAISLPNNVEAWAYRGTSSAGLQWQDCYDSLQTGIEKCTDGNPNQTGWVNGPDDFEFFQIGYRPKNGNGKKHKDFPAGSELSCPNGPCLNPTPTNSVQCYPTHGTNPQDQIIKVANINVGSKCSGTTSTWQQVGGGGGDQTTPANNNHYDSTFTLASDAPADCKNLYTSGSSPAVQSACSLPIQAIIDACPFNGGQVSNACGLWTLQSCPLGGTCKIGNPGSHQ